MAESHQRKTCRVCEALPDADLVEFNLLLADPENWPSTIFAEWNPPKGTLPSRMRNWGGVRYGLELLRERGIEGISQNSMDWHFVQHVPHNATTQAQLEEIARMALPKPGSKLPTVIPPPAPRMFTDYYSQGIRLGLYALRQLEERIETAHAAGETIPDATLWKLADLGAKLASQQLGALTRGKVIEESETDEGFRVGTAPLPSQRIGGHRIRVIDGQSQPIVDGGRADRMAYNKRAEQEGGARISGR
jgi:hypothetical protein